MSSYSTKDLKYLTTEQALNDLASFQQSIRYNKHWTGKWVAIGGSYPGSLAAYYRLKYPDLIVGALASSAPVKAEENFSDFDAKITEAIGPRCANKMRAAINEVESRLEDEKKFSEVKSVFNASMINNKDDFLFYLAQIETFAVQYGQKNLFCTALNLGESPLNGLSFIANTILKMEGISPLICRYWSKAPVTSSLVMAQMILGQSYH